MLVPPLRPPPRPRAPLHPAQGFSRRACLSSCREDFLRSLVLPRLPRPLQRGSDQHYLLFRFRSCPATARSRGPCAPPSKHRAFRSSLWAPSALERRFNRRSRARPPPPTRSFSRLHSSPLPCNLASPSSILALYDAASCDANARRQRSAPINASRCNIHSRRNTLLPLACASAPSLGWLGLSPDCQMSPFAGERPRLEQCFSAALPPMPVLAPSPRARTRLFLPLPGWFPLVGFFPCLLLACGPVCSIFQEVAFGIRRRLGSRERSAHRSTVSLSVCEP